jgi:hypothetical protein
MIQKHNIMKTRTLLLAFALFFGMALSAQVRSTTATKAPVKSGTSKSNQSTMGGTTTTTGAPACYVGKTWKLAKIEKFGVEKDPGDDQKTDMLVLNADGTFKIILKGVEKSGTYSRGSWLNLKPADGSEALPIKVESCNDSELKADWRDGDTHNHFTYKAQ